jgi:hypothetical protein
MISKLTAKKKAAAVKLKLKKLVAVQEHIRLEHEAVVKDIEEVEVALHNHEIQQEADEPEPVIIENDPVIQEKPVVLERSRWQRFLDSF